MAFVLRGLQLYRLELVLCIRPIMKVCGGWQKHRCLGHIFMHCLSLPGSAHSKLFSFSCSNGKSQCFESVLLETLILETVKCTQIFLWECILAGAVFKELFKFVNVQQ